jgi:hypothetical protein
VVWCDVVWCGVVWCGVVWCGVVWLVGWLVDWFVCLFVTTRRKGWLFVDGDPKRVVPQSTSGQPVYK